MPIDARQQPPNLLRPNRARDRWHRPVGHDGHGRRQIPHHCSAIARIPSELLISTRDFRGARKITWCMICGLDEDGTGGETESYRNYLWEQWNADGIP